MEGFVLLAKGNDCFYSVQMKGLVGSAAYVAPEVLAGKYTEKVDVWATGVLLHALLIGTLSFYGGSCARIFEAVTNVQWDFQTEKLKPVSEPAKDLLSKMLSREVEKRLFPDEVLNHLWVLFYTKSDMELFKESKLISPYKSERESKNQIIQAQNSGQRSAYAGIYSPRLLS
ncbi:hypothetical protein SUGI_1119230 [Cryptomeria japonica]|nr:hypothetical protein SUGI_1119230 [Cryptomeria japonica]